MLDVAYCVVHGSALFAFLTFGIVTNGLEFFYFYPREAETILQPFTLHTMMWLGTAAFSIFGLIVLRFRADATQESMNRLWSPSAIVAPSISFTLLGVLVFPDLASFWWIGAAAVAFCWLGFGSGIASVFGDVRKLVKSFFASLLGIAAIVEIWSLSHWLYEGVAPSVTFGSVGSDLEMNLVYANSWFFLAIFVAAWLSPLWGYIAFRLFRTLKRDRPGDLAASDSAKMPRMKLELDDLILAIAITLTCVLVGFYAYFRDPPWLVGTDAYWRYNDPLERVVNSGDALATASNEWHGLYLLVLYGVHSLTGLSPFSIVKASPMVLATFLSLLTYFGVANYRRSRAEGFFAAFFSATTFPTTLGIFASIHANWFAMIVALATVFVLISIGESSRDAVPKALLLAFLGVFLLLLYPWMWGIVALSTLFAGFVFLIRKNWKMSGASLSVPLLGLVSAALAFTVVSEGEKANLINAFHVFSAPLASQSLVLSPFGVIEDSFRIWALFLNPLLAILVVIGALFLVREKSSSYRTIMLSWMLVSGIGTFFAVTLQTEIWRIWYVQPLWLLGGAGVSGLLRTRNVSKPTSTSGFEAKTAAIIFIAGLAVYFLEPLLGASVFYVAAVSPVMSNIGRKDSRASVQTPFATTLILFVCVFFLNHALRSLYPLFLDPHNYLEH
jgi:hypothetical protein